MTTRTLFQFPWDNTDLVWIFQEAAARYEAIGDGRVAKRLERMAANFTADPGGTLEAAPTSAQRELLQAEFAKGTHLFLRFLADGCEIYDGDAAHDLRSLEKLLALEEAERDSGG
jgi:hypothetical protein